MILAILRASKYNDYEVGPRLNTPSESPITVVGSAKRDASI